MQKTEVGVFYKVFKVQIADQPTLETIYPIIITQSCVMFKLIDVVHDKI